MRKWSRYNTLFRSERYGYFLYNALSNVMLELDETHFRILQNVRDNRILTNKTSDPVFFELLEEKGFLSTEENEQQQMMQKQYQRNEVCFNTAVLGLTICPTLACNFECPYCYEHSQNDGTVMNEETIEKLIAFIRQRKEAHNLSVTWYGGEPTLAFEVVKSLTERFLELYPEYDNSCLVTNGYLLDQEKIDQLNDLKVRLVQITLDGNVATHDKRRMLKNGGKTFQKILDNVNVLMSSSYKGGCTIRVNIDKTNQHEYQSLHLELLDRYKGKNLSVHPGHVHTAINHSYDHQCSFCSSEWADFAVAAYHEQGIVPRRGFYPGSNTFNICIANSLYGYVVGPAGELYKCWEDVGKEHMVIGTIYNEEPVTNRELVARYSIGTDPFNDSDCMKCPVMPICGGGCVNRRLRAQQFGEEGIEFCSLYKERLVNYLEAYYDTYRTKELCSSILGIGTGPTMIKGYRMVQPEPKKIKTPKNILKNLTGHGHDA